MKMMISDVNGRWIKCNWIESNTTQINYLLTDYIICKFITSYINFINQL